MTKHSILLRLYPLTKLIVRARKYVSRQFAGQRFHHKTRSFQSANLLRPQQRPVHRTRLTHIEIFDRKINISTTMIITIII
jgi:hypothetical protein